MTPDELYTLTFDRFRGGWGEVWAFREVAELGIPAAEPHIARLKKRLMDDLVRKPEWTNMVRNRDEFERMGGAEGAAIRMTAMSLISARASIDAASLVFAHSIVDAAAAGFLRVTAMMAKLDWQTVLEARKFTLADVRLSGYQTLFESLLMDELDRIERNDSLPKKGEQLLRLCRPEPEWILPIKYDKEELVRIDGLRHEIVHGNKLGKLVHSIKTDLEFLENIGWYFFTIVNKRYATRLVRES